MSFLTLGHVNLYIFISDKPMLFQLMMKLQHPTGPN